MQFEITIDEYSKISSIINLLNSNKITSVCLTQKYKHINNIAVSKKLLKAIPQLDITLNFSVSLNYSRDDSVIENSFLKYVNEANELGIFKFLIISGVPRRLYSTINLLNFLKFNKIQNNMYFCAYNPFLTNNLGEEEEERLRYKLGSKVVSGVYLQLGDNLFKLKNGIKTVRHVARGKKIYGSALIPNNYILNHLKYKSWYGVKFSEDFINNLDLANIRTKEILELYRDNNIEPLIDVIPFNNSNLHHLKLLGSN